MATFRSSGPPICPNLSETTHPIIGAEMTCSCESVEQLSSCICSFSADVESECVLVKDIAGLDEVQESTCEVLGSCLRVFVSATSEEVGTVGLGTTLQRYLLAEDKAKRPSLLALDGGA